MTRPIFGLVIVGLGASLAPLDIAVNVALPAITAHFRLALGDVQWLVICYVLVYGSLMLVCGKLGDLFGRKPVLQAGLLLFTAASLAGGFATGGGVLLTARIVQGIAANRVGTPADVASAVRYITSPEASWITGSRFDVDGGVRAAL